MERRKGVWATPVMLVVIGCILTAGFSFIGWCGDTAVNAIKGHFTTIEDKEDMLFKKIGEISSKENADVLCLTRNLGECCGEKASLNC